MSEVQSILGQCGARDVVGIRTPVEAALQQRFCPEGGLRADLLLGTSLLVLHWATSFVASLVRVGRLDSQSYAKRLHRGPVWSSG